MFAPISDLIAIKMGARAYLITHICIGAQMVLDLNLNDTCVKHHPSHHCVSLLQPCVSDIPRLWDLTSIVQLSVTKIGKVLAQSWQTQQAPIPYL